MGIVLGDHSALGHGTLGRAVTGYQCSAPQAKFNNKLATTGHEISPKLLRIKAVLINLEKFQVLDRL
ncbi:hypothetical protein ACFS07_34775 [Undibacterium arcticum]